jgi:hypothetical protein
LGGIRGAERGGFGKGRGVLEVVSGGYEFEEGFKDFSGKDEGVYAFGFYETVV